MNASDLKQARRRRNWTQVVAANRLRVSQPYLAMLEAGHRRLTERLAHTAMRVYGMSPSVLPLPHLPEAIEAQELAEQLAALGYPLLAHLRTRRRMKNPAEVLISALAQENLEARLLEALPWLLVRYPDMDATWMVEQARLKNLQNRLGYVVSLAEHANTLAKHPVSARGEFLSRLKHSLEESKLAKEDTLCRILSEPERRWLRQNRPEAASEWNLLTDLRPETLDE